MRVIGTSLSRPQVPPSGARRNWSAAAVGLQAAAALLVGEAALDGRAGGLGGAALLGPVQGADDERGELGARVVEVDLLIARQLAGDDDLAGARAGDGAQAGLALLVERAGAVEVEAQ